MSDSIRNFIIRTLIDDSASTQLELIRDMAQGLVSDVFNIKVDADTSAAQDQLDSLSGAGLDATGIVDSLTSAYDSLASAMSDGQAIQMTADEVDALGFSMDSAVQETSVLSDAWNGLKDVASGVSDSISGMIESIDATKIIGGVAIALGANQAFKTAELQESIYQGLNDADKAAVAKWMDDRPPEVSFKQRATALVDLHIQNINPQASMDFTSAIENYTIANADMLASKTNPQTSEQIIASLVRMSTTVGSRAAASKTGEVGADAGGRTLSQYGIAAPTTEDIGNATESLTNELKGLPPEAADQLIWLTAVQEKFAEKTGAAALATYTEGRRMMEFNAEISNLTDSIETGALPYLEAMVNGITKLAGAVESVPGLPQLLGMATVLAIVAGVLPMVIGFLGPMIGLLGGAAGAFGMVAVSVGEGIPILSAIGGVIAGVVGWPLILAGALIAVGVAIAMAEEKTHFLSNALTVLSKSEMGKDLLSDVQALVGILSGFGGEFFAGAIISGGQLAGIIGDLFGKADGLYKYLKDSGSLDIVLGFAMSGPVGMMYFALDHIEKLLQGVWDWARGIWDSILEGIVNLPQNIADLINKVIDEGKSAVGLGAKGTLTEQSPADQQATWMASPNGPNAKDLEGNRVYGQASAADYTAAWTQASTGVGQKHTDSDEAFAALVKTAQSFLSQNPTVVQGPEGDQTKFKENTPSLGLGDANNTTGSTFLDQTLNLFHAPSYDYDPTTKRWTGPIAGEQGVDPYTGTMPERDVPKDIVAQRDQFYKAPVKTAHTGAESSSKGLISVLPGEPIVPADLAHSSQLLDILSMIATGPTAVMPQASESAGRGGGQPITIYAPVTNNLGGVHVSGQTERIDEDSIMRKVQELLDKNLNKFELSRIIEEVYGRGARYYNG